MLQRDILRMRSIMDRPAASAKARGMWNRERDCASCVLGRAALPGLCPLTDVARPAGSSLFFTGAVSESIFYLREGAVVQSQASAEGRETVCSVRGGGALLGIEALIGRPADTDVWALTDVVLCSIRVATFRAWLGFDHAPRANAALVLLVEEAARRRDERRAVAGSTTARVARFVLDRHAEGGRSLRLKVSLLARVLGMRPETLSRVLKKLRDAGALAPSSALAVGDFEKLRQMAGE